MSRKKSERTPRRYRRKPEVKKTKTEIPTAVDVDLRTARPVRRLAGQVRVHAESLKNRCETLEAWTKPRGKDAEPNPFVLEAHGALVHVVEGFPKFFEAMKVLDELGFSPPRKSFTASTREGDRVSVLESFRSVYSDFMDPSDMIDLYVVKKVPGKGGGLVVSAKSGARMKVAKCHVVKLS
jgi:hypothetical protein